MSDSTHARTRADKLMLLGLALLVLFARRPDAFLRPQLFVEDGTVFFRDDHALGAAAILKPYAGYLHLAPRLVAWLAGWFPLEWRPRLYTGACTVVMLALTARCLHPRLGHLTGTRALSIAPLLVPIGPFMFLHLTNLQWFCALFLWLLMLGRPPESWLSSAIDGVLCLLLGLTGPFALATLPLLGVRLLARRAATTDAPWMVAMVVSSGIQGALLLKAPALEAGGFEHVSADFIATQATRFLAGNIATPMFPVFARTAVALWLGGTLCGLVLLAREYRYEVACIALLTALFMVLGAYRMAPEARSVNAFHSGIRYFYLPHLGMLLLLMLGVWAGGLSRRLAAPLLALAVLSAASTFTYRAPPDNHFERYCPAIRAGKPVVVPLQPKGWYMRLNQPGQG